ncbi:MAG: hypothetical protein HY553_21700 [Elusimicrobia bacterium]|nr:hypothetical protein [Elusimicrobiota bacterium]
MKGEWAGSGSFKIDREAALRKLERFQLADAGAFPEWWVRCAIASGASEVRVELEGGRVAVRFKGRRFTPEELDRVWEPLLGEPGDPRLAPRRFLAIGLLAALRLKPKRLIVESGDGESCHRLEPPGGRVEALGAPLDGTLVEVALRRSWFRRPARETRERLLYRCLGSPVPVRLGEEELPRVRSLEGWWAFRRDGMSGWLSPVRAHGSRFDLCVAGVRVCSEHVVHPIAQVDGVLEDDDFRLDLSGGSVLKDGRHSRALREAELAVDELIIRECRRAARAETRRLGWLRDACTRLTEPTREHARPAIKALWDAKLFSTAQGRRISLRHVAEVRRRSGMLHRAAGPIPVGDFEQLVLALQEHGDALSDMVY